MKATVQYYRTAKAENPVKDFLESLSKQQKAKVFRIFITIERYGLLAILPHIKKLSGTPLWEIRILGKDSIRIIYVSIEQNIVCVLHGFIKKRQKTSQKDIEIALNRHKNLLAK